MQEVTLWFWAAVSVFLIVTSFVDGQEVILVADPDISPVGQVRKSLTLLSTYIPTVFNSYEPQNVGNEAVCGTPNMGAADMSCSKDTLYNYLKLTFWSRNYIFLILSHPV